MPTVLCAGMAVLDEVFRVEQVPAANSKTRASAFVSIVGGCAANAAVAIARLGGTAELAAALGDPSRDPVGERILAALAQERVRCSGIVRVAGATSTLSTILVDSSGDRLIVSHRDDRLSHARVDNPRALAAAADAVLVDNWLPDLVVPIAAAARERRCPVIVDGDGPMPPGSALSRLATHLVFSADALRASSGHEDLDAALRDFALSAECFLAVTDGAGDIRWWMGGMVRRMPVFSVAVIDTLAAGDVFHGAFALALAEKRNEVDALRFAAAAAAVKCTRFGGGAGAPHRADVEALLA